MVSKLIFSIAACTYFVADNRWLETTILKFESCSLPHSVDLHFGNRALAPAFAKFGLGHKQAGGWPGDPAHLHLFACGIQDFVLILFLNA